MEASKDLSFKIILLIIILLLGCAILYETLPFLGGVLGAFTVYMLVRDQMNTLTEKKKMKPVLASILILVEVILCFLIPIFVVLWLLVNKVSDVDLKPSSLIKIIEHFVSLVHQKTDYNLISNDNIATITSFLTDAVHKLLDQISSFVINSVVLLLILYFMLLGGRKMEAYVYDILPFKKANKKEVVNATKMMIKSNAIGIPLLAVIQGVIALIGYFIFRVPEPLLFGLLTCFATVLPVVGTALIWFPLAIYMLLTGNIVTGIGLIAYGFLVVANADNVVRFWLQKKMADTHPLVTIFGVIMGLSLFGFWGVIFGPLMLSIFILCFDLFKRDYIDNKN